jgi:hypothetical protein
LTVLSGFSQIQPPSDEPIYAPSEATTYIFSWRAFPSQAVIA